MFVKSVSVWASAGASILLTASCVMAMTSWLAVHGSMIFEWDGTCTEVIARMMDGVRIAQLILLLFNLF